MKRRDIRIIYLEIIKEYIRKKYLQYYRMYKQENMAYKIYKNYGLLYEI